jgi:hypothetical protein
LGDCLLWAVGNFRRSPHSWATILHDTRYVVILTKIGWAIFSETHQGSILWSQFSAIFADYRRKYWRFSQKPML